MFRRSKLYFLLITVTLLLGIGILSRSKINRFISEKMQKNVAPEIALSVEQKIQQQYNYNLNNEKFDFTFLEFSSTGCIECEEMEPVLKAIKNSDEVNVNVVFMHIMKPEIQDWMKYYGISAVPLQVLLDREGKEFYRHFGVISENELITKFKENRQL